MLSKPLELPEHPEQTELRQQTTWLEAVQPIDPTFADLVFHF